MWTVAVVMRHEDVKRPLKMLVGQDQQQSRHSVRAVRTNRSATPFAWGARNGVRTISIPLLRNTSSKLAVNFWLGRESRSGTPLDVRPASKK
jgi:hypothetical protein